MNRDYFFILIMALMLFFPFLGSVHLFDWDEINFAESAREMLITGDWWRVTINFEPFREKPPLFFWMQALSMRVFGVGEYAARFPNAVCGVLTLLLIYRIGREWKDRTFSWVWVLLYAGTYLPHLYFKSGIIDPWFNLFIFLSIYFLFKVLEMPGRFTVRHAALSGMFTGLAILTKGPVAFLLLLLTFLTWWVHHRFRKPATLKAVVVYAACAFGVSSLWFGYETLQNGPWFLVEFLSYQVDLFLHPVAGHKQPFYYHFLVVLLGCFPLSIFALTAFTWRFRADGNHFSLWMKYLFWVVMILFSIVTTKIVHYSSMSYLPLSYLAASVVHQHYRHPGMVRKWQIGWLLVQGILLGIVFAALPLALKFKSLWIDLVRDPFTRASLSVDVPWYGWESLIGVTYIILVIVSVTRMRVQPQRAFVYLCAGTAFTIFMLMAVIVPRIEAYSQRPAIEFFKRYAHLHPSFQTFGYKSYAQYFYGQVLPAKAADTKATAAAQGDSVFVSCKITREKEFLEQHPNAEELYRAGGFIFYKKASF